ncbi:MAG TPA: DUF6193 family natural product biosynthesis protein [Polyangiaceae bacterium]|nr:DUF6193 family natural product biosynthesis protein [Polyangiaceae bacterium]
MEPSDINRRAAELRPTLYPELEHEELWTLVPRLLVDAGYSVPQSAVGKLLCVDDRSATVSCAALERLFLLELWSKGVCYGGGKTEDARAMADAVGAFVLGRATVDEMVRRFPWLELNDAARAHEAGRLVEATWTWRLSRTDAIDRLLMPLFEACARRPRLRALMPFTSHETLLFSRTTGYPYDSLAVCARPVYDPSSRSQQQYVEQFVPGRYEVLRRGLQPIAPVDNARRTFGTGDAEWAATTLESEVPSTWGAAVDGTAEDSR